MTSHLNTPWDVVIVGGGSAGLSAALILSRARRRVLVLDAGAPRNRFAAHMHGVLSRDGYSPLQLVADGRREVLAADGVIEAATVVSVARVGELFELALDDGRGILSRKLVVATGIRDELPDIPGLNEQWGRGAVACPYCDGYESRGKRIGVLLGSVPGVHKAHMVRSYSPDITVFTALTGPLPEAESRTLVARGMTIDDRMIAAIVSTGDTLTGVQFAGGETLPIDALFVEPRMVALDELLRQLGAEQTDTPAGPWTSVDPMFQTSVPGVYAIGNSANPGALVPIAMASGVTAATAINGELVTADILAAMEVHTHETAETPETPETPAEHWQKRYLAGRSWSGNVNVALEREVAGETPGTALDLGSGEGGDALWLARNGWSVTAVDIAPAALAIGAAAQQPGDDITWVAADLGEWNPPTSYGLVTACFLHSTVELPREQILRRAAEAVAPGGLLLVVGHAGVPHWAGEHDEAPDLPTPDDVLSALFDDNPRLNLADWTVETNALIERPSIGHDGEPGVIDDSVVKLRRR